MVTELKTAMLRYSSTMPDSQAADLLKEGAERIAELEAQLSDYRECEQCDNDTGGVQFCSACWNDLAKRLIAIESQLAECQRERSITKVNQETANG